MRAKIITFFKNSYIQSALLFIPYLAYVAFVISVDRGPVDYETFMSIGMRFLSKEPVYTTNSYYPMPYVIIFSFFASLPRPVSMALWLLMPVISAWLIADRKPFVLLFSPVFSHFAGGQSSVFGLIGLWGYRKYQNNEKPLAGIYLALTLLKPQLGLIPLAYALIQWLRLFRIKKTVNPQIFGFLGAIGIFYLPGFIIDPSWVTKWLSTPRPIFERALSGFIPRTLLYLTEGGSLLYWILLIVISALLLVFLLRLMNGKLSLDQTLLWGFTTNPLVHDYDLIQLVAILDSRVRRKWSILLSLPGWLILLFAYGNDQAWYVFTFIAPGLLLVDILINRKKNMPWT